VPTAVKAPAIKPLGILPYQQRWGEGKVVCKARKVVAMRLGTKWNHNGQSLMEYAMVAAIVTAAIVAMSTYVYRSVQATQQMIQEEFSSY
jgi:Flp pilus assembly pilin Flp